MVLFAQGDDEGAGRIGFGLGFRARLALHEEIEVMASELAAQNSKGTGGVAEAAGDLVRGEGFEEEGAQGFVLSLGSGLGLQKEASLGR